MSTGYIENLLLKMMCKITMYINDSSCDILYVYNVVYACSNKDVIVVWTIVE